MSATPIRAATASSLWGSATPGMPMWTGSAMPFLSARRDPRVDRGRVEAQLGRHVARERCLRAERVEQQTVGDERVTLGVAGDADRGERVADLGHLAQQRQPVWVVAGLLLVAADHERALDARGLEPGHEVAQVLPVAHHPRREMRHGPKSRALELFAEGDGRLEALRRRRSDRDGGPCRKVRRLVHRGLQWHELEGRCVRGRAQVPREPDAEHVRAASEEHA